MTIKATIHFLDGQKVEKEFYDIPPNPNSRYICGEALDPVQALLNWLRHHDWIEVGDRQFLPKSQIAKVTWEEFVSEWSGNFPYDPKQTSE